MLRHRDHCTDKTTMPFKPHIDTSALAQLFTEARTQNGCSFGTRW